ncbi:MAG TPA: NAD(P)(+) transhydrogenase (Re/Si-specific) subunit beta, partial [Planctomycetota bacterium]|nr:NAD(P)(+) transhydrogenase (Re/Si-specific) subunit beta [Planctomycetota bacterium]
MSALLDFQHAGFSSARETLYQLALLVASVFFLLGLRMLTNPETARKGQHLAVLGMVIGVLGTLLNSRIAPLGYLWIFIGLAIGA